MTGIWGRIRGSHGRALTCRELVELVTAYLEDGLGRDERRRFEDHIQGCEGCASYIEQIQVTIAVVGHVRADDLSDGAKAELLSAFRGWPRDQGMGD